MNHRSKINVSIILCKKNKEKIPLGWSTWKQFPHSRIQCVPMCQHLPLMSYWKPSHCTFQQYYHNCKNIISLFTKKCYTQYEYQPKTKMWWGNTTTPSCCSVCILSCTYNGNINHKYSESKCKLFSINSSHILTTTAGCIIATSAPIGRPMGKFL